jgi:hypothetical protein
MSAVSPATPGKWAVPSTHDTVEGSSASQAFWRCALNRLDCLSPTSHVEGCRDVLKAALLAA